MRVENPELFELAQLRGRLDDHEAVPGWTVLRFTWEDVTEHPARVIAEANEALARLAA